MQTLHSSLGEVKIDARSLVYLNSLEPETHRRALELLTLAQSLGMDARVLSGRRTCAEQDDLFARGITKARGCQSWHVYGRAFDLGLFAEGKLLPQHAGYSTLGQEWEKQGGVWGGRFDDAGHFEWHPGQRIEDVCPKPEACADEKPWGNLALYGLALGSVAGVFLGTLRIKRR